MLYLVRHGQTEYNAQGRMQGGLDSPLTGLGIEQARKTGAALRELIGSDPAGWTIESSPLPRARATAEIIRLELGLQSEIVLDERLREVSLGSWEGLTGKAIEKRWPDADIGSSVRLAWAYRCPDGENLHAARSRLSHWLDDVGDGNRIVVSHGIAGSLLRGIFAGMTEHEMLCLPVHRKYFFELNRGMVRTIHHASVKAPNTIHAL